ncbi:hypothetical protein RD110_10880 [Rhodoferax koreense]|uniref:Uncharacterized protein n=1 Tax=Rhodoferax koreensis TaxID=1842727 RepID=A0A1P8JVC4_9BURK|nr:hypothetical protein [Rhodoferax koreense]APW37631.1 hypothetical protein RD110_10880 [Rhodoferax koreense]
MNEPIKSGDRCLVIAGSLGDKGPNIGKTVLVTSLMGEHSQHGRIWRCVAPNLVTDCGVIGVAADFAASWLQKLPPAPQDMALAIDRRQAA